MTEQREPSSRLWVSSRWQWWLVLAIPLLPLPWWQCFQVVEGDDLGEFLYLIASLALAAWWLPLLVNYFRLLRCARVQIEGNDLLVSRWGKGSRFANDDDLRLRGAGVIYGASRQATNENFAYYTHGSRRFNGIVLLAEAIFGPLHRECFELYWESEGRSGARVLFYHQARFKSGGEPYQPGMRLLRVKLAELHTARKEALVAADASKLSELEQAREDEREARAELTDRARATRNPIKRMRQLRKKSK